MGVNSNSTISIFKRISLPATLLNTQQKVPRLWFITRKLLGHTQSSASFRLAHYRPVYTCDALVESKSRLGNASAARAHVEYTALECAAGLASWTHNADTAAAAAAAGITQCECVLLSLLSLSAMCSPLMGRTRASRASFECPKKPNQPNGRDTHSPTHIFPHMYKQTYSLCLLRRMIYERPVVRGAHSTRVRAEYGRFGGVCQAAVDNWRISINLNCGALRNLYKLRRFVWFSK